jgi:hypothetical protein
MSSHLHAQFIRARCGAAAVAAGLILASASVACASAADHTQAPVARPTPPSAIHVGATSRTFVARMRELEARGYVQIACTVTGALMFNPRINRIENVPAQTSAPRRHVAMAD